MLTILVILAVMAIFFGFNAFVGQSRLEEDNATIKKIWNGFLDSGHELEDKVIKKAYFFVCVLEMVSLQFVRYVLSPFVEAMLLCTREYHAADALEARYLLTERNNNFSGESIKTLWSLSNTVVQKFGKFFFLRKTPGIVRKAYYALLRPLVRHYLGVRTKVNHYKEIYDVFALDAVSLKDVWNGFLNSGHKTEDKIVKQAYFFNRGLKLVTLKNCMIVLGLLTGTSIQNDVAPAAIIQITGLALGVAITNNNEKDKNMRLNKSWIFHDKDTGEVSIQLDYRHILVIDHKNSLCTVFDINKGTLRDIPFDFVNGRVERIVDLMLDAEKEAALVPKKVSLRKAKAAVATTAKNIKEQWEANRTATTEVKKEKTNPITRMFDAIFGSDYKNHVSITDEEFESSYYVMLDKRRGNIMHLASRIVAWQTEKVEVDIYLANSDTKDTPWTIRGLEANRIEKIKSSVGLRRTCGLNTLDYKFAKIIDKVGAERELSIKNRKNIAEKKEAVEALGGTWTEELAQATIQSIDDWLAADGWNGDGHGFSLNDDEELALKIENVLFPEYTKQGYTFLGGNPDSGILIFVKNPQIRIAKYGQKLAKILLRGGIQLTAGTLKNIEATVIDMPTDVNNPPKKGGYRDGIFMIVKRSVFKMIGQENGFNPGSSWQASVYIPGITALKGMIWSSTPDNKETYYLLKNNMAVVDRKQYAEIYGTDVSVGETVEIPMESIWIMSIDNKVDVARMHISAQIIRRAPHPIAKWFHKVNMEEQLKQLDAAKAVDKRDLMTYMPKHGDYKNIIDANLRPMLKPVWKKDKDGNFVLNSAGKMIVEEGKGTVDPFIESVMVTNMIRGNRKGFLFPTPEKHEGRRAYYQRLMHDNSLTPKIGEHQHVGISVPKATKLEVGDHVIMVTYPALNAADDKGRGPSIFVCEVEKLNCDAFFGVHGSASLNALRDEDGDVVHIVVPTKEDWDNNPEMRKCGMGWVDVSIVVKDSKTNKKSDIFNAPLTGNVHKDSEATLCVFMKLATNVGIADNIKTSIELYLAERIHDVIAPTGETVFVYMSRFVQGFIENKKHITDELYSKDNVMLWLKLVVPEAFEEVITDWGDISYRHVLHPELACQKLKDENGNLITGNKATLEDVERALKDFDEAGVNGSSLWMDLVRRSTSLQITKEGFVLPNFYKKLAVVLNAVLNEGSLALIKEKPVRDALGEEVAGMLQQIKGIDESNLTPSKKFDEVNKYVRRMHYAFKHNLSKASWIFIQIALMYARPYKINVWSQFCDLEFLRLVSWLGDNRDKLDEVAKLAKVNKRHTISRKKLGVTIDKASGHVNTRIWVPKDKVIPTIVPVDNTQTKLETINIVNNEFVINGQVIKLDDKTYCKDGDYVVTDASPYVSKTAGILKNNLIVQLMDMDTYLKNQKQYK